MQDQSIGERIRSIRRQLDLTQSEFSKKLGVIQVSVARYEAGRVPRAQILEKIARIGGVTTSWLLHGETTETTDRRHQQTTPKELSDLVRLLSPDLDSKTWRKLSQQLRNRYQERVREVASRLARELAEYRKVLEAERRPGRRKR